MKQGSLATKENEVVGLSGRHTVGGLLGCSSDRRYPGFEVGTEAVEDEVGPSFWFSFSLMTVCPRDKVGVVTTVLFPFSVAGLCKT